MYMRTAVFGAVLPKCFRNHTEITPVSMKSVGFEHGDKIEAMSYGKGILVGQLPIV